MCVRARDDSPLAARRRDTVHAGSSNMSYALGAPRSRCGIVLSRRMLGPWGTHLVMPG